jgi:hypothetical protein
MRTKTNQILDDISAELNEMSDEELDASTPEEDALVEQWQQLLAAFSRLPVKRKRVLSIMMDEMIDEWIVIETDETRASASTKR